MKFIVSLQSIGNIITNSSSEVFVIAGDSYDKKQIINILKDIIDEEGCSGVGGECDIKLLEKKELLAYPYRLEIHPEKYTNLSGPFIRIDIDWAKKKSIEWIKSHFTVIDQFV